MLGTFFASRRKKSRVPTPRGGHLFTCSPVLGAAAACSDFDCSFFGVPMAFMFEYLDVYQNAVNLADKVLVATSEFPRGFYFLSDQLNRACVSIATNLAEGNGRFTKADRKNFFTIARGSAQECVPLIELAHRRGLITGAQYSQFRSELEIIGKMLSGLITGLDNRNA